MIGEGDGWLDHSCHIADESMSMFAENVHSCKVRIILKYMEVVTWKELS